MEKVKNYCYDKYNSTKTKIKEWEEEKKPESSQQIIDSFVNNTTLIGIRHIFQKKSLFWLLSYIVCVSFSILQSWNSAILFLDQRSHISSAIASKMQLTWPSITICNNVVINSSCLSEVPDFVDIDNNCRLQAENETDVLEIKRNNSIALMKYVRKKLKENDYLKSEPETWISKCTFNRELCEFNNSKQFYKFTSPIYGNCLTFNPAFNITEAIETDIDASNLFIIRFRLDRKGYHISGKQYVSVLVHSPGTTPLMDSSEALDIYNEQNVDIWMQLIHKDFMLKARTKTPTCILNPPFAKSYHARNLFYTDKTPYVYSVEACLKTCKQRVLAAPCGWLDGNFPLLNNSYEDFELQMPPYQCSKTRHIKIGMDECDCPFPCLYLSYPLSIDTYYVTPEKNKCVKNESDDFLRMVATIHFLTNIYNYDEEVLDYDLTTLLGFLGGNCSLWIGFAVVSFLELIELIWDLFRFKYSRKKSLSAKSQSKFRCSGIRKLLNRRPNIVKYIINSAVWKKKNRLKSSN